MVEIVGRQARNERVALAQRRAIVRQVLSACVPVQAHLLQHAQFVACR